MLWALPAQLCGALSPRCCRLPRANGSRSATPAWPVRQRPDAVACARGRHATPEPRALFRRPAHLSHRPGAQCGRRQGRSGRKQPSRASLLNAARALELVIVDDGSTDETCELVTAFLDQHPELSGRLLRKANGGQSSARNVGVEASRGEWVAFLDQDDKWTDDHIRVVLPSPGKRRGSCLHRCRHHRRDRDAEGSSHPSPRSGEAAATPRSEQQTPSSRMRS